MSDEIAIRRETGETKGRYVGAVDGVDGEAELTFSIANPKLVIADHTEVPESMRGRGIGRLLVERLVADARAEDFKVIPLCPYVNAERRKHPEWADIFQV